MCFSLSLTINVHPTQQSSRMISSMPVPVPKLLQRFPSLFLLASIRSGLREQLKIHFELVLRGFLLVLPLSSSNFYLAS